MYQKKWINYVLTPVLGFFPFFSYAALRIILESELRSLVVAFILAVTGQLWFYFSHKRRIFGITFVISALSILCTAIVWVLVRENNNSSNFYIVICEVFLVAFCSLTLISKKYINFHLFRERNVQLRALLDDLNFSIAIIKPILIIHLLCVLISMFFIKPYTDSTINFYLYSVLPVSIVIITHIIHELFRIKAFHSRFMQEEWLPIVTEKGEVTGKIAKSVSLNMKNKFMHPVVRIALVYNNRLYLQKRSLKNNLDPDKFDYPFEKYVLFNDQINITVRNNIVQMLGPQSDISFEFALKYTFENKETKRLNFLYVAKMEDEDMLPRNNKLNGKFWSVKQIEESFADNIFGECFELEFEYIKNKFLLPKKEEMVEMESYHA